MNALEFQLRVSNGSMGRDSIIIDIEQIPHPTIIFFYKTKEVKLNKLGYQTLGININEELDYQKWISMNPFLQDEIKKIASLDYVSDRKLHCSSD